MAKKPLDQDPDFEEGNHEPDIYDKEGLEELEENDEITEVEEGFMEGYEHGDKLAVCAECSIELVDKDIIEEEIEGKHYHFCSKECASAFEIGKKRKQGRLNKKYK
ncbi:hypothetical protein J4440_02205 [Candidatus Woesearchaeota archaeon]|nr:hypothetical protein [Candidatus Woesearchaeota archaeon]